MSSKPSVRSLHQSLDIESNVYSKYITELEKKIEEKSFSPDFTTGLYLTDRPKKLNKDYLEELKKQIEYKQQMKLQERLENQKPAINQSFHGYPNLPQTPKDIRRKRELLQKRQVRINLTEQLEAKKQFLEDFKHNELETAKHRNWMDQQLLLTEKETKLQKKENEKEALVSAWDQAKRARELRNVLENAERKGIVAKLHRNERSEDRKTEDEASQFNFEVEFRGDEKIEVVKEMPSNPTPRTEAPGGNSVVLDKARRMREALENREKDSYQFKIKQLIRDAKIKRNERRVSPSHIGNYPVEQRVKNRYASNKVII